jgi:hypothetical protein
MRELGPQARSLIQRMQGADSPGIRDRERMRTRLEPLFTVGSVVAMTTAPVASAAAGTIAPLSTATGAAGLSGTFGAPVMATKLAVTQALLWGALGLGAGVTTTTAAVLLTSPSPRGSATATAVQPVIHAATRSSAAPPELPGASVDPPPAPVPAAAPPETVEHERPARAVPGPASTLAEETRLLRAAQTARREGKDSLALGLLEQHARRFPHGALSVERDVAQALALCAQGQVEASNRLRQMVLEQAPKVPAVSRILEPCGTGSNR